MNNNNLIRRASIGILVAASFVAVGTFAYRAGQRNDGARELVVDEGTRTVVVSDDWRGPGFGFLLFPLLVIGLILFFASHRGRWRGPWTGRDDEMREWHRRAHGDQPSSGT